MKLNRTYLFIVISSIALLVVLIIQVSWIYQSAKIKEELFNEKARMVLSSTADALSADPETCRQMETSIGEKEIQKTDSLFGNYMKKYDFNFNYSFAVTKPSVSNTDQTGVTTNVFKQKLNEQATASGLELNLIVPDKKEIILADMGKLIVTSVILIIIVLVLFWRTVLLLMKEKRISEHTTDFLNNMTHEFKTPLTNIALAGKMMLRDTSVSQEDKIKHYSGIILEENEKLRLQVEQVLSMTALERGEIPVQKSEFDFHKLILDTLKCINIQIENRKGVTKVDLNAEKFIISGDRTHLSNALSNLFDNAIKYSENSPLLSVSTFNSGDNLVIKIGDKGMGISKEYHKKVFDKFFRVPTGDVHDVKGFGLGLAYIKKIIELHYGTIGLESESGQGTEFTLTIPHV